MSSLVLSNLSKISSLLKATTVSSRRAPALRQYVSWRHHECITPAFGPMHCCCRNTAFHFLKVQPMQLRVYSSQASSIQRKKDAIRNQVRSLLDVEQPTGQGKMHSGDLSPAEQSKATSLIPRYLISIAADPYVQHESILEIFRLYALTMKPLAQDKVDFPEEFNCLIQATEHALQLMSVSELQAMSQYLDALQCQQLAIIQKLIRILCQECSSRLNHTVTFKEAMTLYDLAVAMYPKELPQKFHEIFNEYFLHNIDTASLREKVKLMYFYSLNPGPLFAPLFEEFLKSMIPQVSSMPLKMQGIVASAVLKSGVKLQHDSPLLPKLVPNLVSCLLTNNKLDELETFGVLSELDLMRLSYFHNEDVTSALESFIVTCNEEDCLTMQSMQHFLAFLATRNYHQIIFEKIETCLMNILCDEARESLELSDLARILWAMSAASHKCSSSFVEEMKKELHSQLVVNLINTNLLKFVDALVSLAMMGHVDLELCRHAFLPPKGRAVSYGGHLEVKLLSRISSLRECLSIERPEVVLPQPKSRSVSFVAPKPASQLKNRPILNRLLSSLNAALASSPDVALSFGCPLQTIQLAGICLELKLQHSHSQNEDNSNSTFRLTQITSAESLDSKSSEECAQHSHPNEADVARLSECLVRLQCPLSLEVLDDTSTIPEGKDGRRHTGMLNYKLRLMEKIGWKCVLVSQEDIDSADDVISLLVDKVQHC